MSRQDIAAAASGLRLHVGLKGVPHVHSVGVGDEELVVYVDRRTPATHRTPTRWQGYPVRVVVTGGVRPA